ncbi:MAG: DUF2891 domain-containing protein [Caulobacteraceae bacterium]|nr:DUF2891 domain-containing protein [Caulobacteraceae bacterium]
MPTIDPALAERLAQIALGHVGMEYPNGLSLTISGPQDLGTPRELHPIFFGSLDWHSCVHGHWLLARLRRMVPGLKRAAEIEAHFDHAFTAEKAAGELAYLARPHSRGFERPYGWAWLLMLQGELERHEDGAGRRWATVLRPLADSFAARFKRWLPLADYPVRAGVHSNTAFALALTHEYALLVGDEPLVDLVVAKARDWYFEDRDCQAWEPSGDEFLSSALVECELMRRILAPAAFEAWFHRFLPRAAEGQPATLFEPARVSDRTDGKIAHLDGLNLSRAWCWRGVARALGDASPVSRAALDAADRHLDASAPHVSGDYMGEHWLASFALLALEA